MTDEAKLQRQYGKLFRQEVSAAGLTGDAAWSAIYGLADLMPPYLEVRSGTVIRSRIADAWRDIRPGGTIMVVPENPEF